MNLPDIDSPAAEKVIGQPEALASMRRRFVGFLIYLAILCGAFARPLFNLVTFVAGSDVHSFILLIPFVAAYLIYIRWKHLSREFTRAWGMTLVVGFAGLCALLASWRFSALSENDYLTLISLSFVCFVITGVFLFLGSKWARSAMFPLCFLLFMIPLPEMAIDFLENASKEASAEVASWLFLISGTPVLRDRTAFQLPGMSILVAKECSGIRSSLVLIITSLLAANMFLRTTWRRGLLVAAVIPLGLLRNGFRILVVALLCVYIGPHMINSPIHRRGGPVFFALSLIPLFLMLWAFRRQETKKSSAARSHDSWRQGRIEEN